MSPAGRGGTTEGGHLEIEKQEEEGGSQKGEFARAEEGAYHGCSWRSVVAAERMKRFQLKPLFFSFTRENKPSTQPLSEVKSAYASKLPTFLIIYSLFLGDSKSISTQSLSLLFRIATINQKVFVMPPALPDTFKRSYADFESYPRNLICQTTYRDAADASYVRLRGAERTLLIQDEDEFEVPFRDLLPSAQGMFSFSDFWNPSDLAYKDLRNRIFSTTML